MNRNELRKADINLMVVFEALMLERNVTRVAEKLFLGQPTISSALNRLRTLFNDPALQQLIESALVNNRDLRVAALNVEAFQAQYRIQRADLLPAVSANASESRQRTPTSSGMIALSSSVVGATVVSIATAPPAPPASRQCWRRAMPRTRCRNQPPRRSIAGSSPVSAQRRPRRR